MKQISDELLTALAAVLSMQHPSVSDLLRKYRYAHEADKMDQLQTAYRKSIDKEGHDGNQVARPGE